MQKYKILQILLIVLIFNGCEISSNNKISEDHNNYILNKGLVLSVILQTPLSSNRNSRGDQFITTLKEPVKKGKIVILSQDIQINGLVKRAVRREKLTDKAGLILMFDQLKLDQERIIPFSAIIDTQSPKKSIKIEGKNLEHAAIIGTTAIAGALIGKASEDNEKGMEKGLYLGAALGAGSVLLADRKEVALPVGTELKIKLEEAVFIPKG